jgi:hypothetical protein
MDPNDPTIHGVRYRPAKRYARGRALLAGFGGPAEPVQDLDGTTAGTQDAGVELGLGPEPVSMDGSIGDGRRRGGADQDEADGKGEGSHERTISGSDVRRNRRTGQDPRPCRRIQSEPRAGTMKLSNQSFCAAVGC